MRVVYTPLDSLLPEGFDPPFAGQTMRKKDSPEPPQTEPRAHMAESRPETPMYRDEERTVVGIDITIKGDMSGGQDVFINGCVEGRLSLPGHTIAVGKEGRVKAEMLAKVIQIDGSVEGTLCGEKTIRLQENARVRGDLTAPAVVLPEGCKFTGRVDMGDGDKVPEA